MLFCILGYTQFFVCIYIHKYISLYTVFVNLADVTEEYDEQAAAPHFE